MSKKQVQKNKEKEANISSTGDDHKSGKKELNEDIISAEVAEVLENLPADKRKTIVHALAVKKSHSGPLPDAETIKIYNEVIPNGGDRLMKAVELQLEHRIDIEKKGVKRTFNQSSTGQIFGFTIAVFFGVIAWDLAKSGHDMVASILGVVDLVALVTIFITGKRSEDTA